MNILLVSQCSKRALTETRRILDQFAERCGDRTWQTAITQEGLTTLRKLLKKTARRNTSVACHWIKGRNRTELLWLVGNPRRFNAQGAVPTNITARDVLKSKDENQWHHGEDISLLSGLAALFHDFGKAGALFQDKLHNKGPGYEPYRHEWLSLRMFQALVKDAQSDQQWLEKLTQLTEKDETALWQQIICDGSDDKGRGSPFKNLPPLAKTLGWLILTHHRLPKAPDKTTAPNIKYIEQLIDKGISASWNSPSCYKDWSAEQKKRQWQCPYGTPVKSHQWRQRVAKLAKRALGRSQLFERNWLDDSFSLHLSRLMLMLSDHWYSGQNSKGSEGNPNPWSDNDYPVYANTHRDKQHRGQLNQKLDEHLIGVYRGTHQLGRLLPGLQRHLPAITRHPGLKKRAKRGPFLWQNQAYDLACSVRHQAQQQGFFGVNMASTGRGKTFANARIAYGLSDEQQGCRFAVALGLRTLTLQTGDAMKALLRLDDEDLAVMVGGQAVQELHRLNKQPDTGSESGDDFLDDDQYVSYDGSIHGPLQHWLERSPRLLKMVSAPVLVSTIDHLMPATESDRGGKQIAPMLRLLTSDLILDEPDDFGLEDLPALCRLVNWSGMLGGKVLLSSATLPPSLVEALFDAYRAGREIYQANCGQPGLPVSICCGWFDEFGASSSSHAELDSYQQAHQQFIGKRVQQLAQAPNQRPASLLTIEPASTEAENVLQTVTEACHQQLHQLHRQHHQVGTDGKQVSLGLIRLANINPLVALAGQLLHQPAEPGYRIHYCVYHSQHPLLVRSAMERDLDSLLNRKDPDALWQHPLIQQAFEQYPEDKHIIVVLGTAVTEVGRDHSYNWAIAEPSSMRSLIQLAGRVLRHSSHIPETANLLVLNQNIKALRNLRPAYCRPGFEAQNIDSLKLQQYDLQHILTPEQLNPLNAVARIQARQPLNPTQNLVDLEHAHLKACLFQNQGYEGRPTADLWWQKAAHQTHELQRRTPFRRSQLSTDYFLKMEEDNEVKFCSWHKKANELTDQSYNLEKVTLPELAEGVSCFGQYDYRQQLLSLAEQLDSTIDELSQTFGSVNLRGEDEQWCYHPVLGFYQQASGW